MADLQLHYGKGRLWAALYADGVLEHVGESPATEAKALDLAGVVVVDDESFMRGQTEWSGVAATLADIAAYRHQRDRAHSDAEALRKMARKLMDEADALDAGADQ